MVIRLRARCVCAQGSDIIPKPLDVRPPFLARLDAPFASGWVRPRRKTRSEKLTRQPALPSVKIVHLELLFVLGTLQLQRTSTCSQARKEGCLRSYQFAQYLTPSRNSRARAWRDFLRRTTASSHLERVACAPWAGQRTHQLQHDRCARVGPRPARRPSPRPPPSLGERRCHDPRDAS